MIDVFLLYINILGFDVSFSRGRASARVGRVCGRVVEDLEARLGKMTTVWSTQFLDLISAAYESLAFWVFHYMIILCTEFLIRLERPRGQRELKSSTVSAWLLLSILIGWCSLWLEVDLIIDE